MPFVVTYDWETIWYTVLSEVSQKKTDIIYQLYVKWKN